MAMAKIKETNCPSEGEKREKRDLKRKNKAPHLNSLNY